MYTILIVDDDEFLRALNARKLAAEGYRVLEAIDRPSLIRQLEKNDIHLVLLDIVLPGANGVELIDDVKKYTDAPIIMLTSKDHLYDKIFALDMGADDYLAKPADPKELLSRIKAHIRRYAGHVAKGDDSGKKAAVIRFGPWEADHKTYTVRNGDGDDAGLTKDEFDLLITLAKSPQVVFTRDRLFEILKHDDYETFDRAIDVQIARIRKKLGDNANDPVFIQTVRKVGYRFIATTDKE